MHIPVLLKEVIHYLNPKPGENFIDCTIGSGGHAFPILQKISPNGKVLGIDLDKKAIETVNVKCQSSNVKCNNLILIQENYKNLTEIKNEYFNFPIHGILLDLGFCSVQVEDRYRGFSFLANGPLRMNYELGIRNHGGLTAEKIVNEWKEEELIKIFREYGEERQAKRIAEAICQEREERRIRTTGELVAIVCQAKGEKVKEREEKRERRGEDGKKRKWGNRKEKIHPATKVFQALRIVVNDELNNLKKVLPQAVEILQPEGRLVVISFHSLEDRIVKEFFKKESKDCICPPEIPVCRCDHKATLKILTKKAVKPTELEIKRNPRSRSARLRATEKC